MFWITLRHTLVHWYGGNHSQISILIGFSICSYVGHFYSHIDSPAAFCKTCGLPFFHKIFAKILVWSGWWQLFQKVVVLIMRLPFVCNVTQSHWCLPIDFVVFLMFSTTPFTYIQVYWHLYILMDAFYYFPIFTCSIVHHSSVTASVDSKCKFLFSIDLLFQIISSFSSKNVASLVF